MRRKILVLGSSNIDLIFRIPRFHNPGETIRAENLVTAFGGKGANQAIAAKRLGGDVVLLTKIGNDHYGRSYRQYLIKNGLDQRWILKDKRLPTGLALIELTPQGENRIIVSPGANGSLSAENLRSFGPSWREIGIFVAQLEIPIETVKKGLRNAKEHGAATLLNPSPPIPLSPDILKMTDFLVPNETEARFLTGMRIRRDEDIRRTAAKLLEMGTKNVVITLGSSGLFFKSPGEEIRMEAFKVDAVDTTAAGDAFMGGLACGLSRGMSVREVLRFASAAGALAATRLGAQPSLPFRRRLIRFLSKKDPNDTNSNE